MLLENEMLLRAFYTLHPSKDLKHELGLNSKINYNAENLALAFSWGESPQGADFWRSINKQLNIFKGLKKEDYFKDIAVGDIVYSLIHGCGIVDDLYLESGNTIPVTFNTGVFVAFDRYGFMNDTDHNQILFYGTKNPFADTVLPKKQIQTISVNGIVIPDISYKNGIPDDVLDCAVPVVGSANAFKIVNSETVTNPAFAYPNTMIGHKAATLHAQALVAGK